MGGVSRGERGGVSRVERGGALGDVDVTIERCEGGSGGVEGFECM